MSYNKDNIDNLKKLGIGDRVQKINNGTNGPNKIMGGVIESYEPPKMIAPKEYWKLTSKELDNTFEHFVIMWDNGNTERVIASTVDNEDTEIEREYRKVAYKAMKKINNHLIKATKAISDAKNIADKYGVAFQTSISPISQSYYPSTISDMYPDLDPDFINDVNGTYHSDDNREGWEHSAVCY